ncbi:MAG: T9SS type A sorting domain-containing protein [candidate division WOR-3 bacterium]|nr:T9SS type A sorting domain-containing protein [candidate division WOR-3 bacterium]
MRRAIAIALISISLCWAVFYKQYYQGYHKLTRSVTVEILELNLLCHPQGFLYLQSNNEDRIACCVDQGWHRIVYSRENQDDWIRAWGDYSSGTDGFKNPVGITKDAYRNVYVADAGNKRIMKLHYNTGEENFEYVNAFPIEESISIWDIDYCPGAIYVSDPPNHCIYKMSESGTILSIYGELGTGLGQFRGPKGIAAKGDYVYVIDEGNNRVVWLEDIENDFVWRGDRYITEWPDPMLVDVEVDSAGFVYVVDNYYCHILKYDPTLSTVLGVFGERGYSDGQFYNPRFLYIDNNDVAVVEEWGDASGIQYYGLKPGISNATVMKTIFDATEENNKVYFTLDGNANVTIRVRAWPSSIVRMLFIDSLMSFGNYCASWDGKDDDGKVCLPGKYFFDIFVESAAGSHTVNLEFWIKGTLKSGSLDLEEHWTEEGEPYVLTDDVIAFKLTIDPGVKVMPADTVVLSTTNHLYYEGSIRANGSALNKILFTPHRKLLPEPDPLPKGFWQGICFTGRRLPGDTLTLTHCMVEGAGSDIASILALNYGPVIIEDCDISHSGGYGYYEELPRLLGGHAQTHIRNCCFHDNDSLPIRIGFASMFLENNDYFNNAVDAIEVGPSYRRYSTKLENTGFPYWFISINTPSYPGRYNFHLYPAQDDSCITLEINPGTELLFGDSTVMQVSSGDPSWARARVVAIGTASDSIVFSAMNPNVGWQGLLIRSNNEADTSYFEYCRISYGGQRDYSSIEGYGKGNIRIRNTPIVLRNCLITESQSNGLDYYVTFDENYAFVPEISNNKFADNDSFPLEISAGWLANCHDNTFHNNDMNYLCVAAPLGIDIDSSVVIGDQGIPYLFDNRVTLSTTTVPVVANVDSNVSLFFVSGGFEVGENCGLNAEYARFSIFDSDSNANIDFKQSCGDSSRLHSCIFDGVAIRCYSSSPQIRNCQVTNCSLGIMVDVWPSGPPSLPIIDSCRLMLNRIGISFIQPDPLQSPITNCDFVGNKCAFMSTSAEPCISAELNYWGDQSGPWDPIPDDPLYNPGGRGDSIGANVWYEPYREEPVFPHGDTLLQPNGDEILYCESNYEISWLTEGTPMRQELYYTTDFPEGGREESAFWQFIDTVVSGETRYDWRVPSTPSNRCRVAIRLHYDAGSESKTARSDNQSRIKFDGKENEMHEVRLDTRPRSESSQSVCDLKSLDVYEVSVDISDHNFAIVDTISPQITMIDPNGGEYFIPTKEETIRWQATDNHKLDHFDIYLSTEYGSNYSDTVVQDLQAPCAEYVWVPAEKNSYICRIKIVACDSSENATEDESDEKFFIPVMSTTDQMTAYNNARRVTRSFSTNLHLVYSTQYEERDLNSPEMLTINDHGDADEIRSRLIIGISENTKGNGENVINCIYYDHSSNLGDHWDDPVEIGEGKNPSIATSSDASIIGISWTSTNDSRILYRYYANGQWSSQIYTIIDSVLDMSYSPVSLQLHGTSMCFTTLKTTRLSANEITQDVIYSTFPYDNPSSGVDTVIDHWRITNLGDDSIPRFASLSLDESGEAHYAWEKPSGPGDTLFSAPLNPFDIFYTYESAPARKIYNISDSEENSNNPSIDCYGGHAYVVWQEESDGYNVFLYKRNYVQFPPKPETDTISQTTVNSLHPVSKMGGVVLWAEGNPSEIYGRIWDSKQEIWLNITNWSNTPEVSTYPQVEAWQSEGGTDIIGCWTEDTNISGLGRSFSSYLPGGDYADIAFPSYCLELGDSMSTPFTLYRDSISSYEDYWFDYGTDSLVYYLPYVSINSQCKVRLELYRPESSVNNWKVRISVNDTLRYTVKLSEIGHNVLEYDISSVVQYSGEIRLKFELVSGNCILIRRVLLYEYERTNEQPSIFASGPQSSGDEILGSIFFSGIYPNPGKEDTKIKLNATHPREVSIRLYDVSGRMVNELFKGEIIGVCEIPLKCERLASGIYFVRVVAGNDTFTEKVILLR